MITAKIKGIESLRRNAETLARELGDERVLMPVLKEAAQPLLDGIRDRLDQHDDPRTPEKLSEEWILAKGATAQGRATVRVGPKAGKGSRGFKAWFLERGTSRQAATPVVRPAYDAFAPTFAADLAVALREKVVQVVSRLSKRAVRR